MKWLTTSLLALLLSGCASASPPDDAPAEGSTVMQKPPFGAIQIRDAQWEGKTTIHRIETEGREPFLRVTKWVEVAEDHAAFQAIELDLDRQPIGDPMKAKATWGELVDHARFPAEMTTVTETSVTVPAGTFQGWLYTVETEEDGEPVMLKLYFARELPGPPVRYDRYVDGERVYRMELIDSETRTADDTR